MKQHSTAENGQIVCAMINGEATLKKFYKKDGVVTLRAENENYAPWLAVAREKGNESLTRNEHFIDNIVFLSNHSIYHRFFGSVRKMSECFSQ